MIITQRRKRKKESKNNRKRGKNVSTANTTIKEKPKRNKEERKDEGKKFKPALSYSEHNITAHLFLRCFCVFEKNED